MAKMRSGDGGAINEETGGKILFSGNPVVKNNVDANGNARNVNIRWNMTTKPQVIAELKDGAEIGVTCSGVFTSSENTGYNDVSKFTCDKTYYIGITKNSSGQLELVPDPAHYEVSGNTATVKDAIGWETLCDMLEGNAKGYYTGKTVVMGDSFTITRMAGNDSHPFTGTFDGNEKTLTANITTGSGNCAPFSHAENATFRNIKVDGTLTTSSKFAAAIAAHTYGTTNINKVLTEVTPLLSVQSGGKVTGVSFMALTKPEFRFYTTLTEEEAIELNSQINVTTGNAKARFVKNADTGAVMLEVFGIDAANMDKEVKIEVGNWTIKFCGNDFAWLLAKSDNAAARVLGAALYNYGLAAKDCFPA